MAKRLLVVILFSMYVLTGCSSKPNESSGNVSEGETTAMGNSSETQSSTGASIGDGSQTSELTTGSNVSSQGNSGKTNSSSTKTATSRQNTVSNIGHSYDNVVISSSNTFKIAVPTTNLKTKSAADFGMSPSKSDNTEGLLLAFDYCKNNPGTKLVIPMGTYNFTQNVPNRLDGANDIVIDGQGSTFVFQGLYYWLYFTNCKHVEVKNLNIDWNWDKARLASVVKVLAVNTANKTVDLEFPEYDSVSTNVTFFDFNKMAGTSLDNLTPGAESYVSYWGSNVKVTKQEKIKNNALRITYTQQLNTLVPGEYYLVRHYSYGSDAFVVHGCSDFTVRNVNIWSSAGMAFKVGSESHHYQLVNCTVKLKANTKRHITATADCLHIANTSGYGRIEGCTFEFSGDDCINIHDNVGELQSRVSSTAITVRRLTSGVGDTIVFNTAGYDPTGFSAKVTKVEDLGNYISRVTFDKAIPSAMIKGYILFNTRYNSGHYLIKNNTFGKNRARGTLLGSGSALVEGNTYYRTQGAAILVVSDIHQSWCEGTGLDDLIVRNNTFEECNVSNWTPVVNIAALNAGKVLGTAVFRNLVFEGNTFKNFPSEAFGVQSSKGVIIRNNSFINNKPHETNLATRGMIKVQNANNVQILNNTWTNSTYMKLSNYVNVVGNASSMNVVSSGNVIK